MPAGGDGIDPRVEVVDEERVHRVTGVPGSHVDVEVPVLGDLPDGLRLVRQEAGIRAQQPPVPGDRPLVVGNGQAGEEIDAHAYSRPLDVVRDVDGVLAQRLDRHDLQRALVGGGQDDARGRARLVGLQPADGDDAPPVAGLQPGEAVLRARRGQVVAEVALQRAGSRPRRPRRRCAARGPPGRCCSARRGRSRSPGRCRRAAAGRPARCARPGARAARWAPVLVIGVPWSASAQDGMVRSVTRASRANSGGRPPRASAAPASRRSPRWVSDRRGLDFGDPDRLRPALALVGRAPRPVLGRRRHLDRRAPRRPGRPRC